MSDKSLNNLKTLWENLDVQKTDIEENQNKDPNSLDISILNYDNNFKWIPPDFAKLSTPDYSSKNSSNLFSMAYNAEKRNPSSPNVSLYEISRFCPTIIYYFFCGSIKSHHILFNQLGISWSNGIMQLCSNA